GDYFARPSRDQRPELSYQATATLKNMEKLNCAVDQPCLNVITFSDAVERHI
ncbi:hypothetical protein EDC04DRAFT_2657908, partial [Pisolithus marmoratus]